MKFVMCLFQIICFRKEPMNILFYDFETTGFCPSKNAPVEIGYIVDIKGQVIEEMKIRMRPFDGAKVEMSALKVNGLTLEEIQEFQPQDEAFARFKRMLDFCSGEKFMLCGYNSDRFDMQFLSAWFQRNKCKMGHYFYVRTEDVYKLARRHYNLRNSKPKSSVARLS